MKITLFFSLAMMMAFSSCTDQQEIKTLREENRQLKSENQKLRSDLKTLQKNFSQLQFLAEQLKGVKARIVTNRGEIELKFYPEKTPLHCFNFITRAEGGYYDNSQFHRVVPGFMIQGGDPNSKDSDPYNDGQGEPLVNIPHEFNDSHHRPGVLSMARVADKSAGAGSQFFIMHGEKPQLDGEYTAFGEVTSGMGVVNEIANARTYGRQNRRLQNHPIDPIIIRRIEVYR